GRAGHAKRQEGAVALSPKCTHAIVVEVRHSKIEHAAANAVEIGARQIARARARGKGRAGREGSGAIVEQNRYSRGEEVGSRDVVAGGAIEIPKGNPGRLRTRGGGGRHAEAYRCAGDHRRVAVPVDLIV